MTCRTPVEITRRLALAGCLAAALMAPAWSADLPPDVAAKVEKAKKRLNEMAADPAVVAAVREANGRDGTAGMNNGKWADLPDSDPAVKALMGTKVSAQFAKWETADASINKLVLRDQKGNLIGASVRPLLFNNATRPQFANPMKGQPWSAGEVKPDPTTQVLGVHVGVPVIDGGKTIGVLHAGVTAK